MSAPRDRSQYDAGRKRSGPSGPTTPEAERPGCRVRLDAGATAAVDRLAYLDAEIAVGIG